VAQHVDALGKTGSLLIQSTGHFFSQALCAHVSYALSQKRVRQAAALGQAKQSAGGELLWQFIADGGIGIHGSLLFGNQGISIEVLRW